MEMHPGKRKRFLSLFLGARLLQPYPAAVMLAASFSKRVGSPRDNGAGPIEPLSRCPTETAP